MVEADFSGSFTNPENCKENDIGIVTGEGSYEEKTSFAGVPYKQLNMEIEVNGKKLTHSPNMQEGKNLVKAWGKETKNWIEKKFVCHVVNYKSMGQTKQKIEIEPMKQEAA